MNDINKLTSKKSQQFLFEIRLDWLELKRGILSATDVRDTLRVATPQTFGGAGEEWSPEHLSRICFVLFYDHFPRHGRKNDD